MKKFALAIIISICMTNVTYADAADPTGCDLIKGVKSCTPAIGSIAKEICNGNAPRSDPGQCEMTVIKGADTQCAKERMGAATRTNEVTNFNDVNCAGGLCDNATPGIAHRSWPLGSTVMVCKLQPQCLCAPAVIMDRGPANYLGARTIDANPALTQVLGLRGRDQAVYMLLKAPGVAKVINGADDIRLEVLPGVQGTNSFPGTPGTSQGFPAGFPFAQSSPFAQTSPVPVSNQIQTQYPTVPGQNPYPTGTSSPTTGTSSGPPVGMILAQPHTVLSGHTLIVSWTSVHLKDSQPCQIYINDTQFLAQGNEGSRQTQAGPSSGPEKLTMKCTDQQGNVFTQSDTVTVQ